MIMPKIYYHFTSETLRDGRPIPAVGEWLTHDGPVVICETGLHASETPYDALQYAPGQMLHRVELDGVTVTPSHTDKVVAQRRKIIATIATRIRAQASFKCNSLVGLSRDHARVPRNRARRHSKRGPERGPERGLERGRERGLERGRRTIRRDGSRSPSRN